MNRTIQDFIKELSSGDPTPGGGGASALLGTVGVSLCSMVANLTSKKQQYAKYQADYDEILIRTDNSTQQLLSLIQKDTEVFTPLSQAYHLPEDEPGREEKLQKALVLACSVPIEILEEVYGIIDILEQLLFKGSKLAISDVGVAATACRSAMEGAAMNVYINTKLMKDKTLAAELNAKTATILKDGITRCDVIYQNISEDLRCI